MLAEFLQFLFSGLTVGATYALAALGFTIVYNASNVINFAQGEFLMLGGMLAVVLLEAGAPAWVALPGAILLVAAVGVAVERLAIRPARDAEVVTLVIITLGVALVLRGAIQMWRGTAIYALPPFSGDAPIMIGGAALAPQSLWVIGVAAAAVALMWWFFERTRWGKAMLATASNRLAARLVGIRIEIVLMLSFALAAALGALGGIIVAPITLTSFDVGIMLGLKGFVAAVLGGLGNGVGAVAGGLLLGVLEAMAAGYISSSYKDAVPFVVILLLFIFLPRGLLGAKAAERV
jgi:branched-chain amino acid transport system permease protein